MKFVSFDYDPTKVVVTGSEERKEFNGKTSDTNIVYFFYKDEQFLYIGESKNSLNDRCFTNSPKHSERDFFKTGNKIRIIVLDSRLGDFERQAIETNFILTFRSAGHPLKNEKA